MASELNPGQSLALEVLQSGTNVFVTGGAGTGKSFLLKKFLKSPAGLQIPVLASTGAAAVLIGGRTFHSFFGLGILEGGAGATIERALKDKRLLKRLRKISSFVVDEVSMIPGEVWNVAEKISRLARDCSEPWGGLRVVAVGDFAQLPPVTRFNQKRDWAFLSSAWKESSFHSIYLQEIMRSKDEAYNQSLSDLRLGNLSERLKETLNRRMFDSDLNHYEGSILYAKKVDVEKINQQRLSELSGNIKEYETIFRGEQKFIEVLRNQAPIPQRLEIKKNALVMIRQNDPQGKWVNGTLAYVQDMFDEELELKLFSGLSVFLEKSTFSLLNAEGEIVATAKNFPVNLAYALTIHKSQGATLDKALVSLNNLWEPGQAYVAMSRVRSEECLFLDGWDERSIFADPKVIAFHKEIHCFQDS